jgi:hypothetical protein
MRETPCAARGAEPLAFCSWRWGVAGRVDLPAEVGGGGPKDRRQGGASSPSANSLSRPVSFKLPLLNLIEKGHVNIPDHFVP